MVGCLGALEASKSRESPFITQAKYSNSSITPRGPSPRESLQNVIVPPSCHHTAAIFPLIVVYLPEVADSARGGVPLGLSQKKGKSSQCQYGGKGGRDALKSIQEKGTSLRRTSSALSAATPSWRSRAWSAAPRRRAARSAGRTSPSTS